MTPNETLAICQESGLFLPFSFEETWPTTGRCALYILLIIYTIVGCWVVFGNLSLALEFVCNQLSSTNKLSRKKSSDSSESTDDESLQGGPQMPTVGKASLLQCTLCACGVSVMMILFPVVDVIVGKEESIYGTFTLASVVWLMILGICTMAVLGPKGGKSARANSLLPYSVILLACLADVVLLLMALQVDLPYIFPAIMILIYPISVAAIYLLAKLLKPSQIQSTNVENSSLGIVPLKKTKKKHSKNRDEHDIEEPETPRPQRPQNLPTAIITKSTNLYDLIASTARQLNQKQYGTDKSDRDTDTDMDGHMLAHAVALRLVAGSWHTLLRHVAAACHTLTGRVSVLNEQIPQLCNQWGGDARVEPAEQVPKQPQKERSSVVQGWRSSIDFSAPKYIVGPEDTSVTLLVHRSGKTNRRLLFKYETLDGTAAGGIHYINRSETLVFNPNERSKQIVLQTVSQNSNSHHKNHFSSGDELAFYVRLEVDESEEKAKAILGQQALATVLISDHSNSTKDTKISLVSCQQIVVESAAVCNVAVVRKGQCNGQVTVRWQVEGVTARPGVDFISMNGTYGELVFEPAEFEKNIAVPIINTKSISKSKTLKVQLTECTAPASLSSKRKDCLITIVNDARVANTIRTAHELLKQHSEDYGRLAKANLNWKEGVVAAAADGKGLLHTICAPWKLCSAILTPPINQFISGWPAAITSSAFLFGLAVILRDLVAVLCCIGSVPSQLVTAVILTPLMIAPLLLATKQYFTDQHNSTVWLSDEATGIILSWGSSIICSISVPFGLCILINQISTGEMFPKSFNDPQLTILSLYDVIAIIFCLASLLMRRSVTPVFDASEFGGPMLGRIFSVLCSFCCIVAFLVTYVMLSIDVFGWLE